MSRQFCSCLHCQVCHQRCHCHQSQPLSINTNDCLLVAVVTGLLLCLDGERVDVVRLGYMIQNWRAPMISFLPSCLLAFLPSCCCCLLVAVVAGLLLCPYVGRYMIHDWLARHFQNIVFWPVGAHVRQLETANFPVAAPMRQRGLKTKPFGLG